MSTRVEGAGAGNAPTGISKTMGPARRAGILIAMGIAAGSSLTLVALLTLGSSITNLNNLTSTGLPAVRALQGTIVAATETQMATHALITAQSTAASEAAILAATQASALQQSNWEQYQKFAINGKIERTLGQEYLTAEARSAQIGTAAVAAPKSAADLPGLINDYRVESAKVLAALGSLESSVYEPLVGNESDAAKSGLDEARRDIEITFAALFVLTTSIGAMLFKGARREQRSMSSEAAALRLTSKRADFEGSLQRGLEMAPTQAATLSVLGQALTMVTGAVGADLILADSSLAHFETVLDTRDRPEPACDVTTPGDCPACAGGQPRLFEDNSLLDTCRFLRARPPVWTMCVPVSIAGQTVGVIRSQASLDSSPPASLENDLALVARKAGERIGTQRVLATTEEQARSDPLTGLANRRAFETEVSRRQLQKSPYVIAFADLDHFKLINDTHGHDVGDRSLRMFAQVLRDAMRPGDLLSRYGGEEFVALLAGCTVVEARAIGDRVRSQLALAIGHGSIPTFTVTIGLAEAEPNDTLVDVIANADAAMLLAKSLGRDRVFAVGDLATEVHAEAESLIATVAPESPRL